MNPTPSRRDFVRSAASFGAVLGAGNLRSLPSLYRVSAAEARWDPDVVRFDAGIEPLVQLLEVTPRDRVLEEFAGRIKQGTSYREVLTALHLAGIRNIPPRPDVGWKFHAVLVLHSAHLASLAAAERERWLPIFFALDFFKSQQAYDARESEWSMGPVDEGAVPEPGAAIRAFREAMDGWDDEAADVAAAGLVRSAEPQQVFELLAHYGMRDFRNIGHKPIYVANGWRTLEFIGWQHAEPIVRSLVYALLNHHDQPNPASSELEADAPWKAHQELMEGIDGDWTRGAVSTKATSELLSTLRSGSWAEASGHVVRLLSDGVAAQSVVDALFAGAAELLIRQPSIVSLHGMTSTNALAYAYRKATDHRTRRLLLLQNAAFLVQFRDELKGSGPWGEDRIDELEPDGSAEGRGGAALESIFEQVGKDGYAASRKALAYLQAEGSRPQELVAAARRSSMLKCKNGHDYKFSSAIAEDYGRLSPGWRERYLAASAHYLRGTGDKQNRLVQRTLEVLSS